jgi:hypothetical protein
MSEAPACAGAGTTLCLKHTASAARPLGPRSVLDPSGSEWQKHQPFKGEVFGFPGRIRKRNTPPALAQAGASISGALT